MNALKYKPVCYCSPAYGVRKSKRAQVTYNPTYPAGETTDTGADKRGPPLRSKENKQSALGGGNDWQDLCTQKARGKR